MSRWYGALVGAVALERVAELVVARRNEKWARSRGAIETGQAHYPPMVALHTGFLAGCLLESRSQHSRFVPAVSVPAVAGVLGAQALRWWCIRTLGPQWNTRVLVVPDAPLVDSGPYAWFKHPNYVAVAVEGAALPLARTNWITAATFAVLNAALMRVRITTENAALQSTAYTRHEVA